jgi:hypothetical protein
MDAGAKIALAIAAIIMAAERALKSAPDFRNRLPRIIASENWEFAPLVLLIVAGLIWMVRFWEGPNQAELANAEHKPTSQLQSANPIVPQPASSAMTNTPANWRDEPAGPWGGLSDQSLRSNFRMNSDAYPNLAM